VSKNDPTELLVALHFTTSQAIRVSIDGNETRSKWIPKRLISSMHETGKTTQGTDRQGHKVMLPMADLVIPEWLAIREELI
jgi:hypothetical protein